MTERNERNVTGKTGESRNVRLPVPANDAGPSVEHDLPESIAVRSYELELLEACLPDLIERMIAANDN